MEAGKKVLKVTGFQKKIRFLFFRKLLEYVTFLQVQNRRFNSINIFAAIVWKSAAAMITVDLKRPSKMFFRIINID
jgi:hypothetical protein